LISLLIVVPLIAAAAVFVCRQPQLHRALIHIFAVAIAVLSGVLFVGTYHSGVCYFIAHSARIEALLPWIEGALGAYLLYVGVRNRRVLITLLAIAQTAVMLWVELRHPVLARHNLFVDKLSILMTLIIGIIGGLICMYAAGYMRGYHERHHPEVKDNRHAFAALLFVFLSAMFGVVFSNNLTWLYVAWEVTTLCSFLLIGYTRTDVARRNALRALEMNLIGGLAFAAGIAYAVCSAGVIELDQLMHGGQAALFLSVVLISIAGLTKSAQLPFSSWLLGAMVAPTPVSALLHSSTMVKAGVYIILRFASVFESTLAGMALALVGAVTFLIGSFIAVSESDAKRVLAYSTVANLGLIVLCAGVGTYEAVWAAALLIVFHAVSKCLLFLCVGIAEQELHTRNIDDMAGMIVTMPLLSIMMQIGMAGMFLAPFGMLISKWAVLKALVDYNPLLAIFVIFGSAATLVYWVKWIGKLIIVTGKQRRVPSHTSSGEWGAVGVLAVLTVALCGLFPLMSSTLIEPYVISVYGRTFVMSHGNVVIMTIMLAMVLLFPLSFFAYGRKVRVVDAYLGGANTGDGTQFTGAAQMVKDMDMGNYYLDRYFGEKRLLKFGIVVAVVLIAQMFICGLTLCG